MRTTRLTRRAARYLVAALLCSCAACGGVGTGAASSDSVYVGLAVADAGDAATYRHGASLALQLLNASRTPEELPLAIREAPAAATTPTAIAEALRDDADVVGVVGHARDAATRLAAPVYSTGRPVVVVSPTARDDLTAASSNWVFRVAPTGAALAQRAAGYAVDSLRARRAGIVYPNDAGGRGFARVFAQAYAEAGGTVTERDPYLAQDSSPFEAYASRLALRGAAAVAAAGRLPDLFALGRALAASGVEIPLVAAPDPWDPIPLPADSVEAHMRLATAFDAERPQSRAAAEFVGAYASRFGTLPDARAALAYDAAMLIGLAVREVGVDRGAIRDWIARTGRGRPAHAGASGPLMFDGSGNPVNKTVLVVDRSR